MQSFQELGLDPQTVLNMSPAVTYVREFEPQPRVIFVSQSVKQMLGFDAGSFIGNPGFLTSLIHPDDLGSIEESLRAAAEYGAAIRDRRIRNAAGVYRWFRDSLRIETDATGTRRYGIGTIVDVTDEKAVQQTLEARSAEYRILADHSSDLISRITIDGRFVYQSPSARRVMGFAGDDRQGKSALGQIHVDDHAVVDKAWRTCLKTRTAEVFRYRAFRADGSWVTLEAAMNPVVDPATDKVTEFVIVSRDVTERAEAEKRLADAQADMREQAEIYDLFARHSSDFFLRLGRDGAMTHVSPSHERILGRRSLVREGRLAEAVHPDDLEATRAIWAQALIDARPVALRTRVRHSAGHWVWIECRLTPVADGENGAVSQVLALARDITSEISAGRALADAQSRIAEQSELYELLANRGAYLFIRYLPDGRVLHASANHERLLGKGTLVRDGRAANLVHPDDLPQTEAVVRQIYKTQEAQTYRHRYLHEDGAWVWLEVTLTPIVGRDGVIAEFIAVARDIGEQIRRERDLESAHRALNESRSQLQLITDNIADVVTLLRPDGSIAYMSPSAVNVVGYTPAELSVMPWGTITRPDDLALLDTEVAKNRAGQVTALLRYRVRHKNGRWIWLERRARAVPVHDFGEGIAVISIIADVTEQVEREEDLAAASTALEESRASLQTIMDNSIDVIAVFGPDRSLEYLSASCEQQSGYTVDDFRAGRASLAHSEDELLVRAAVARENEGGEGETFRYRGVRKGGQTIWLERRGRKVYDATGALRHVVTVTRDISEQVGHEQEIETANRQLETAKIAAESASVAKSQFLATMSHELRTPMTGIMGMLDLLKGGELSPEQARHASLASESAESLLVILNDILDFSKIEAGQMTIAREAFDLAAEIGKVNALLSPLATAKGDTLKTVIADGLPSRIWGDPARLRQVLFNLIGNAVKFTADGLVGIAVSSTTDGRIRFAVTDSGAGIPAEVQPRLFRPFIQGDGTSSRKVGGTGLGLAISRSLIEAMGGEIGFTSVDGQGSCFWFDLPLAEAPAEAVPASVAPAAQRQRRRFDILVAEDHPVNQQLIAALLKREGHRVTVVPNGERAVEAVQAQSFDLVLMDIQMPVLDGIGATRAIRALAAPVAAIPIVAITANALRGDMETYLAAGMTGYVSKPLRIDALREAMETAVPHADDTARLAG